MKKIVRLWIVLSLALSLVACGNETASTSGEGANAGEDAVSGEAANTGEALDGSTDSSDVIEDETKTIDNYVGAYYVSGPGAKCGYMITQSGAVEKLGDVYGESAYTSDGQYAVWRDNTVVNAKQPGSATVTLAKNADDFVLQEETGLLIIFCDDGIYAARNISDGIAKVVDMPKGVYRASFSVDGQHLAYISTDSNLHLLELNSFTDSVIATDVDYGDSLVCISANEIYYNGGDMWDGTTEAEADYDDSFAFRHKHLNGMEAIMEKIHYTSPNHKYMVCYEDEMLYRYKITQNGLEEKTEVTEKWGLYIVSDDGDVCVSDVGELALCIEGETVVLTGEVSTKPFGNGVFYYVENSTLKAYDLDTRTTETVAENIKTYQVHNGYCYYKTPDEELYRIGISEKLGSNLTGFIH